MLSPQFIEQHWPLTNVSFGETFQSYPTRQVVQINAAQGSFVAKIDHQPQAYAAVLQAYSVFDYLALQRFPHVPALLKTTDGQSLVYSQQRSIAIMEYLGGDTLDASRSTWGELGTIARTLNTYTSYPNRYAIDLPGVIAELTGYANVHPQQARYLEFVAMLTPLLQSSAYGLIHGEINLANAARRTDGTLALLDWDEAGSGPTVLEAGYPLIAVFLHEDLQFDHELASAFYQHYYAGIAQTDTEKDLVFRAALLHALRSIQWANPEQRWERVCYAVAQREALIAVLP